jgi:hypothetical protein
MSAQMLARNVMVNDISLSRIKNALVNITTVGKHIEAKVTVWNAVYDSLWRNFPSLLTNPKRLRTLLQKSNLKKQNKQSRKRVAKEEEEEEEEEEERKEDRRRKKKIARIDS